MENQTIDIDNLLQIGTITSTHGIRGEVKVFPMTDDNKRFKKLKECFIEYRNEWIPVVCKSVKFFKNMVILGFEGIDNINDVEKYRQCKLYVDRQHAVALEKDEYFIADLIGLSVYTQEDNCLGVLTEVIPTGANDVYVVVDTDKKERLIPAIKDCILAIDLENKKMTVKLLKGMEE